MVQADHLALVLLVILELLVIQHCLEILKLQQVLQVQVIQQLQHFLLVLCFQLLR
jgi:hypothetical protein